jgi:hypothetical protein
VEDEIEVEGFTLDAIDEVGVQVFEFMAELGLPIRLAVLGLCRGITMIGGEAELDIACKALDTLSEHPYEDVAEFLTSEEADEDGV